MKIDLTADERIAIAKLVRVVAANSDCSALGVASILFSDVSRDRYGGSIQNAAYAVIRDLVVLAADADVTSKRSQLESAAVAVLEGRWPTATHDEQKQRWLYFGEVTDPLLVPLEAPDPEWERIGAVCSVGRRSLWMKLTQHEATANSRLNNSETIKQIELRAGREGCDSYVLITRDNPLFAALLGVLLDARFAAQS